LKHQYTNSKQHEEPKIEVDNLIYLLTKNITMPKGRASKLVPKFVGQYRVSKVIPATSN
jgi:hypothetical protein